MKKHPIKLMIAAAFLLSALCMTYVGVAVHMHPPEEVEQIHTTQLLQSKIIVLPRATEVETEINKLRTDKGLATFNSDVAALDVAAQARAEGMCADNNWSHKGDWAVLDKYYAYSRAGENLYFGSLQDNQAADAIHSWSLSPSHLQTLMSTYTEIGVGVKSCPGFQGNPTAVIITNYFGVPR